MSRIKLLLLILIIAALGIVFFQNREPIPLKILCADSSHTCLYQTPPLPLAIWMAISAMTGAIANLLVQTLNRYGYYDSRVKQPILDDDLYPNTSKGKNSSKSDNGRQSKYSATTGVRNYFPEQAAEEKSYEVKQEPQNVERSGSTYSYKYREAGERPKNIQDSTRNNSVEAKTETDSNADPESREEDWI